MGNTSCADCGFILDVARVGCPRCGSERRSVSITVTTVAAVATVTSPSIAVSTSTDDLGPAAHFVYSVNVYPTPGGDPVVRIDGLGEHEWGHIILGREARTIADFFDSLW